MAVLPPKPMMMDGGIISMTQIYLKATTGSDFVSGTYSIDGMGGNDDLYPLGSIPEISEFLKTSSITILILLFSSIAVISIFRKK